MFGKDLTVAFPLMYLRKDDLLVLLQVGNCQIHYSLGNSLTLVHHLAKSKREKARTVSPHACTQIELFITWTANLSTVERSLILHNKNNNNINLMKIRIMWLCRESYNEARSYISVSG